MSSQQSFRFPGESPSYRDARNKLLEAEVELRRKTEQIAALRRQLPVGGEIPQDYIFTQGSSDLHPVKPTPGLSGTPDLADSTTEKKVRMSELFAPGKDSLILYSFMFGPNMKEP